MGSNPFGIPEPRGRVPWTGDRRVQQPRRRERRLARRVVVGAAAARRRGRRRRLERRHERELRRRRRRRERSDLRERRPARRRRPDRRAAAGQPVHRRRSVRLPPATEKIAVIRSPQKGFDVGQAFTPGATYAVVDAHSGQKLLEAAPAAWNGGATDTSSGDKAWWFDFSSVTTPGDYFVLDEAKSVRSHVFRVATSSSATSLVQAIRMLYYQRDGIAKTAKYAGADWADGHGAPPRRAVRPLHRRLGARRTCTAAGSTRATRTSTRTGRRPTSSSSFARTSRRPTAFADDYEHPRVGQRRARRPRRGQVGARLDGAACSRRDGSVLSVVGHAGASPPSSDTSPCSYGPANTSAALLVRRRRSPTRRSSSRNPRPPRPPTRATRRRSRPWRRRPGRGPKPTRTSRSTTRSNGLASGEQEVDAAGLAVKKVQAAVFLFELTGDATYQTVVDGNYTKLTRIVRPVSHGVARRGPGVREGDRRDGERRPDDHQRVQVERRGRQLLRHAARRTRTRTSRTCRATRGAATRSRRCKATCSPTSSPSASTPRRTRRPRATRSATSTTCTA